jgi:hypothetical protein
VQLTKNILELWAKLDVVKDMDMCTKMKQLGVKMQKQIVIVLWLFHDFITNFMFFKKTQLKKRFSLKIITITYNVERCLREFFCIFWISPNLVKYIYGWLSQHHKIENKIKYGFWKGFTPNNKLFIITFVKHTSSYDNGCLWLHCEICNLSYILRIFKIMLQICSILITQC